LRCCCQAATSAIVDAAVEALAAQDADFDFQHI
jgi:hypothetical protein